MSPDTPTAVEGAIRLPWGDNTTAAFIDGFAPSLGPHRRTLRIALALKGGVSLAVWIGGAVAELDVLRRLRIGGDRDAPSAYLLAVRDSPSEEYVAAHRQLVDRASVYARLLFSRGYDRVEFDVLAGASAGGLNAVMFAVAQRAGATTDDVLKTWLSSGDVWQLLRGRGVTSVDSVLRGDDYFWKEMFDTLTRLNAHPLRHSALVADPVTVELSATILDGASSSERSIREGKAHFHFAGGGLRPTAGRDIPGSPGSRNDTATRSEDLARLAYAARTTSSFPGAFEPAKIYSGDRIPARNPAPVDMSTAFHAHRRAAELTLDPFRVVDGGVTDNIPIERALHVAQGQPSEHHVNRAIIYLDPSPKLQLAGLVRPRFYDGPAPSLGRHSGPKPRDPRSYFLGTVFTSIGRAVARESQDDEVEEVERFRSRLYLAQGRDELFAPLIETPPDRADGPAHVMLAYARHRTVADLDLLTRVLIAPSEWQLTAYVQSRSEFMARSLQELSRLARHITNLFNDFRETNCSTEAMWKGPQAAVDASRCLLGWIRAVEDVAYYTPEIGLAQLDVELRKKEFNRVDFRRRLYEVHADALKSRDKAVLGMLDSLEALPRTSTPTTEQLARTITTSWIKANFDWGSAEAGTDLWETLDGLTDELRVISTFLDELDGNGRSRREQRGFEWNRNTIWAQSPWSGIGRSDRLVARDLAPIVAASGIPLAVSQLTYDTISAGCKRRSDDFAMLRSAQMMTGFRRLLRLSADDVARLPSAKGDHEPGEAVCKVMPDDVLGYSVKLAGAGLGNFAGFLSREWRTNDWWWGRADAAAGAVRMLETFRPFGGDPKTSAPATIADQPVPRAETSLPEDSPDETAARIAVFEQWRLAAAASSRSTPADVQSFMNEVGSQVGGLSALKPSYKNAVAARLVRLTSQAVVRGAGPFNPRRFTLWLLRPLLVLVPVFFDPPRVAIVAALLLVPIILVPPVSVSKSAATATWMVALAVLVALILVASYTARIVRASRTWNAIGKTRRDILRPGFKRAGVSGAFLAAAAVIACILAFAVARNTVVPLFTWIFFAISLALTLFGRSLFLAPRLWFASGVRASLGYLLAAGIGYGAWLAAQCGFKTPDVALVVGLVGAAIALVLTAGWVWGFGPGTARVHTLAWLVGSVIAAAVGIAAALPYLVPVPWPSPVLEAIVSFWLGGTVAWWSPSLFPPIHVPDDAPRPRR